MKRVKKIIFSMGCTVAAVILIAAIAFGVMTGKTQSALENQVNADIDMSEVKDGIYTGTGDGGMVQVSVEVTVENHKLTDVTILEHQNGQGQKAEAIVHDMVARNTYDVDEVSGATISSKTIKNAVNQALRKGAE